MKLTRRHLLAAGGLLLAALLVALLLGGELRQAIAVPFLYALWLIDLFLAWFPQATLWAVFVAVALLVALGSLRRPAPTPPPEPDAPFTSTGRVVRLAGWIVDAGEGHYFKRRLLRLLLDLTMQAHDQPDGLTPEQTLQVIDGGWPGLPPDVQAYLADAARVAYGRDVDSMARQGAQLRLALRRLLRPARASAPPDPAMQRLVAYLESELELSHEHRDH